MLDHLERLSIFADLDNDELDSIALFSEDLEFDEGEVIISEHSKEAFDLFVLIDGSVEVIANADANHNTLKKSSFLKKTKMSLVRSAGFVNKNERRRFEVILGRILFKSMGSRFEAIWKTTQELAIKSCVEWQ